MTNENVMQPERGLITHPSDHISLCSRMLYFSALSAEIRLRQIYCFMNTDVDVTLFPARYSNQEKITWKHSCRNREVKSLQEPEPAAE